jgi:ubiquinone/menaquinone biosynthesis C-methylase UbiE
MDYDEINIADRYNSARSLPEATMSLWLNALVTHLPIGEIKIILDVGCGTGRFSAKLADKFNAQVVGVDPSRTMLIKARESILHPSVLFQYGDAQYLPVPNESVCLLYLSMVYHHIADPSLASREFHRVLRTGGFVCIRNSTRDLLDKVLYLEWFPEAMDFNLHRIPSQQDVIETLESNGFILLTHEVIQQPFANSLQEYGEKIRQRALSDLAILPDSEFKTGVQRMMLAIKRNERPGPIIEPIDLFIFRKRPEFFIKLNPSQVSDLKW